MAPTHNNIGIGNLSDERFLSLKISCVIPCLTAISDSFWILLIEFSKLSSCENEQSIVTEFLPKKLVNLLNCEFDRIGLFKT